MSLADHLTLRFARSLFAGLNGRAFLLSQMADAESNGESKVFERLLGQIDDPALRKMVEKHQADEVRHTELFRAAVARTGVEPGPVPDAIKVIDRLDEAMGGFLNGPIRSHEDVMKAYLVLQVIEERALEQFRVYQRVASELDPETAETFRTVIGDEERHVKYCHAISRRYAPDEATRARTLAEIRTLEAASFAEVERANMQIVFQRRLVRGGIFTRLFWQTVQRIGHFAARHLAPRRDAPLALPAAA